MSATTPARAKAPRKKRPAAKPKSSAGGRVLITGASGFLGRHVVSQLIEAAGAAAQGSSQIRALVRRPSLFLERQGVDMVMGDICDPEIATRAMEGVTAVYHLAGFVSRDPADGPRLYQVHVDGTRTVLRAAAAAGVKRVVVASTSGTVAVSRDADAISNESAPYRHAIVSRWPYYLSKIYQEQTSFELGRELGLEVVVVNPSLLLGPDDERGSSTGDVEKVMRGHLPVVPRGGGVAFVDARDAAAGCILAMERGVPQERYLLSAANMTLEAYLGRVARLAGVVSPRTIDAPAAMRAATRLAGALFKRFDLTPPIDQQSLEMARHTWYVDAAKARDQLGWQPRDPQATLVDTVRDIRRRCRL